MNSSEDIGSVDALKPSDLTEGVHLSRIKASIYPVLEKFQVYLPNKATSAPLRNFPRSLIKVIINALVRERPASIIGSLWFPL